MGTLWPWEPRKYTWRSQDREDLLGHFLKSTFGLFCLSFELSERIRARDGR